MLSLSCLPQTLSSLGILPALEVVLSADDVATKNAAIDILNFIIEFSPSFIRDYTLQQAAVISREEVSDEWIKHSTNRSSKNMLPAP